MTPLRVITKWPSASGGQYGWYRGRAMSIIPQRRFPLRFFISLNGVGIMRKIYISDATLRSKAAEAEKTLSFRDRLNIAQLLEKTGVDAIELPGLLSGKEDAVICRTIAESVGCKVCVPCGADVESIQNAWNCISGTKNPSLQVVLPVSTVQMEYMYHLKADKMLAKIEQLCTAAAALTANVEFVAVDASRAEDGFVAACCEAAARCGATAVTLCDDSSCLMPEDAAALVSQVKAACNAVVYFQPGNGLQMAAACAAAAILAGADGIKTQAAADGLSAAVMGDIISAKGSMLDVYCSLDTTAIHNLIAHLDSPVAPVVTSAPAAADDTCTLEPDAQLNDVAAVVGSLGYELSDADMGKVYQEFVRVSSRKGRLDARELEAIVATTAMQVPSTYHLISYVVNSGNVITATANITLEKDGERLSGVSVGDGPIDAAFHAIEQIIGHHYELDDFQIQSVTKGREAMGSSLIRLRDGGMLYSGTGISTDIIGACIRAYLNALNKIVFEG